MTSDTIHDIRATFTWSEAHAETLRHIAETDEYYAGNGDGASPSSSTNVGMYDWPELKDAIKFRIQVWLEEQAVREHELVLHPAATLIPFVHDADQSANVMASSSSQNLTLVDEDQTPQSPSRTSRSPNTNKAGVESPAPPESPHVSAADTQNFFPSKRQPLSNTGPPLTTAQSSAQTAILFAMLDDFDLQPPFTIQRVAELVLNPHQYYRHPHKWISALKRCLAVTATRDAFPISPVLAPVGGRGAIVNGAHPAEDAAGRQQVADMSELEMDRLDGLPPAATHADNDEVMAVAPTRSRSSSSASMPDPLFSPIPFLLKHESSNQPQPGQQAKDANGDADHMEITDNIPDLELGGADRTQAGKDSTPRELVDFSPPRSTLSSRSMAAPGDNTATPTEQDMDVTTSASSSTTSANTAERVDDESPTSSTPDDSLPPTATSASWSANSTGAQDLGVPHGQIDEMDNPARQIHALSSTTTTPQSPTDSHPASSPEHENEPQLDSAPLASVNKVADEAEDATEASDETRRHSKRRKSVASIHD